MVAHLNVHTAYDLLRSSLKVEEAVLRAKELGYNAIAITDLHVMYGIPQFYDVCVKHNIKPLLGMSVVLTDELTELMAVVIAKSDKGLKQLFRLSSEIMMNQHQHVSIQTFKSLASDVVVIFQNMREAQAHWLEDFPEETSLYVDQGSYQSPTVNRVWAKPSFYNTPDDKETIKVLAAIRENKKVNFVDKQPAHTAHIQSVEELYESEQIPTELLERTDEIAQLCDAQMHYHQSLLPEFQTPNNESADEYLWQTLNEALAHYQLNNETYRQRLAYEYDIITSMGYADYFLIVSDLIQYAKSHHIMVGPGRGSSAGSLVSYLLNITTIDPIKNDLLFERFLNPDRVTMPDIDIDFEDTQREKVIQYVQKKYGDYRVAGIITFGHLSTKAVARDVGRVMGFDDMTLNEISKCIPKQLGITLDEAYQNETFRQFVHRNDKHEHWFHLCQKLEGLPRNTSTHAAGIIINDQPLYNAIPLTEGDNGLLTQWTMTEAEKVGLLKIDFLGLRNLTIIHQTIKQIKFKENKTIDIEQIPMNDPEVFQLLAKGDTTGIFQLESTGVRKVLQRLQPQHFEDIVAVTSLYRPGPMEEIPTYIKRRHQPETVTYLHPDLEPILKRTYGVIIYQEQIMQIASKFAGFSYGEADILRRAMSKKNRAVLENERQHFINGASQQGYETALSEQIFDLILKFADYGFPRAHAVSYSKIAYIMTYLKVHYASYFYANILSNVIGNVDKTVQIMSEARKQQITINGPHINHSRWAYVFENNAIYMSLGAIKDVGYQSVQLIVQERQDNGPYTDFFNFCDRIPSRIRTRRLLEPLILTGALDCFGKNRATLLQSIDQVIDIKSDLDQNFLDSFATTKRDYFETEEMPDQRISEYEKQYLGFYISTHPIEKLFHKKQYLGVFQLNSQVKQPILITIDSIKIIRTKKGQQMAFVTLNDGQNTIDGVIFPGLFQRCSVPLEGGVAYVIAGKFEKRQNKWQMIIEDLNTLEQFETHKLQQLSQIVIRKVLPDAVAEHYLTLHQEGIPVVLFDDTTHQQKTYGYLKDNEETIKQFITELNPQDIRVL